MNDTYVMNQHAAEADKVLHTQRYQLDNAVERAQSASARGLRNALVGNVSAHVQKALLELRNLADPLIGDARLEPGILTEIGHHLERAVELCKKARGA